MTMSWMLALIGAVAAHAIWVPWANLSLESHGSPLRVDLDSVAYLLAGEYKDGFPEHARSFTQHPYAVLYYFGSLYISAAAIGMFLHRTVRRFDLDRKFSFLRFNNQWHYLFFGESNVDAVLVTVTCQHQGYTGLYAGILDSYTFTGDGQLESIVLLSAARAELSATSGSAPQFVAIPGDKLLLWSKDINTLNVDYLKVEVQTPSATPGSLPATSS
jgi:hypothetical protein